MIRKIIIIVLSISLMAAVCFAAYCGTAIYIKKAGVRISPRNTYEPGEIKVFLQNDPKWKDDSLGSSRFRLGGHGCLVSILASSLNAFGFDMDVSELNELFTREGVYNSEGEVIWYRIGKAVPGVGYRYKRVFSGRTLERDLKEGRLPLVMVRYNKTGVFHWVMIIGADEEDFLIIDPLKQDKKPARLGTHGRVHAYRVLVREE